MGRLPISFFLRAGILIVVVFSFLLFSTKQVKAGCQWTNGSNSCGNCGGTCGGNCTTSGNWVTINYRCCATGVNCGQDIYLCDTPQEAKATCGGGGGCIPWSGYCDGGGPAGHGCQAQSDVNCSLRNTLGAYGGTSTEGMCKNNGGQDCNWDRVPNENVGKCSGWSCTAYCYNTNISQADCGNEGCSWTNYSVANDGGYCASACSLWGASCGQPTCQDTCGVYHNCGANISCCTPLVPGPVSLSSPNDGATSIPTTTVVQAAYNAATFNWGRNCAGNTNTFKFYLDTSTNPTTLKCTNTASPVNSTNISSGCQVSNLAYVTRYYWKVVASNGNQSATSPTWSFTTLNPNPWWQVKDADVVTNGNLTSSIPSSCILPGCSPVFDIAPTGGYPGVPSYTGSYDFSAETGTGNVSSYPTGTVGWNALTQTSFKKVYDYAFFKNQIPAEVQTNIVEITTPSVNGGFFNSGGTPARGYVWYHFNGITYGDLTINGNLNLTGSRKVVLLVEGANLNIIGRINIQNRGQGFFMAVVGKTTSGLKGNIIINPTVSHPTQPGVEGIYFADGNVSTGAGNNWLYIRGAIAAMGGLTLQRNLTNNSNQPAEYFEYAPDLALLYPAVFRTRPIKWKEVVP